ncbi:MAG: discoidin domain-containing protein [Deltaproteobacteria bacterium]|nr:discoidin domain-containing protein [Deltaproteobacteria bacterium]
MDKRMVVLALVLAPMLAEAGGFKASSVRKDSRNPATWDAASALDGDPKTAWMIDAEDESVGQYIQVDVPASTIDKLALVAGWDRDDEVWGDYPRLKAAKIEIFQNGAMVGETTIAVEDKRGWQILDIPDTKVEGAGGSVRLTITEVYPGGDFNNLGLSDLRVHLKEFPAGTAKIVEPAGLEAMIDGNPKTVYTHGTGDLSFTMTAPGYGLASIGMQPGPGARPKTVEITANDNKQTVVLEDKAEMQWFLLPVLVGYTGSSWGKISVKVIDTYSGPGVAFAEVALNGATIEEF